MTLGFHRVVAPAQALDPIRASVTLDPIRASVTLDPIRASVTLDPIRGVAQRTRATAVNKAAFLVAVGKYSGPRRSF